MSLLGGESDGDGRMSIEQQQCLLEFMEDHPSFARGQFLDVEGKQNSANLWEVLSTQLNNLEGPKKSAKKWKRIWIDLKNKTKRKDAGVRSSRVKTGGDQPPPPLSDMDQKIIDIITQEAVYGIRSKDNVTLESEEPIPSTSKHLHCEEPQPSTSKYTPPDAASPQSPVQFVDVMNKHDYTMAFPYHEESSTIEINTCDEDSARSTPERSTSKRKRKVPFGKNAVEHFVKSEEQFNLKIDKILEIMNKNNHNMEQILEERKGTNKLFKDLINVLKNK